MHSWRHDIKGSAAPPTTTRYQDDEKVGKTPWKTVPQKAESSPIVRTQTTDELPIADAPETSEPNVAASWSSCNDGRRLRRRSFSC